ncbi:hypothetical protein E4U60_006226 [Claviceps pazoutovae]|uniref:Uncharacterized protein n=1 Tax=Claviceps pazoutovae TaxID=1649127 RepID=A0A9P7MJY5_9HYPO|nr:hypothetical protein E4U60_006226 [Claviceps pazoutovae]
MAPSQCFHFSNLTLHGYASDHKDNYYDSQSSSRAKVLHSKNTEVMSSMSDPSGNNMAEIMRELQEERRLRKEAEDRAERQRLRMEEAQDRAEEAVQQLQHQIGPLEMGQYLKECHMTEMNFSMTTNLAEATKGPVADASERRYPQFIQPWIGFPEKQKEILDRLPSHHTFTSNPTTTTRGYVRGLGNSLNPIASEVSLVSRQEKVVIEPLRVLLEEIRVHPHLQELLGIHGEVKIDNQMNGVGTSTNRSQATNKSLGKNGKSDLFCSFKSASGSDPTKFILKWMGETKTPHKVHDKAFQTALPHEHVIDLRQGILGDNEVRNTVVEIIIQLYSAMVEKGVRYGSDVDGDDRKMHLSAVSQRLAFTVQAIQAPVSTREWMLEAEKLRQWEYERDDANDYSSGSSPKEAKDHSARRPPVVEYKRDPFNTRSATRNRLAAEVEREEEALDSDSGIPNQSADEVENEEEASDSDSESGKTKTQNSGMHNRPDGRRKMQNDFADRSYCTHECVRGLTFGTPLDKNCPNVKDHGSKHINRQDFLRLMGEQLDDEKAHANCEPINASGHIGYLFKIRLPSHGYTLVAKAVGIFNGGYGAPLIHEEKMYNHLRDLQGRYFHSCLSWFRRVEWASLL